MAFPLPFDSMELRIDLGSISPKLLLLLAIAAAIKAVAIRFHLAAAHGTEEIEGREPWRTNTSISRATQASRR
jgi:hypothetical protein